MIDWKIQPRSHECQGCGQKFADKQPYFTLLIELKHQMERQDVCVPCWQSQHSQSANNRKGFLSFWQGLFTVPPPAPPEPILKETAESLLRKLLELNDPKYLAACFILAVMLERKRILKVKAQNRQGGQRTIIYEHGKTGDIFTILDPNLQLHQLDQVQHDVAHLLEHGLNIAPSEQPALAVPSPEVLDPGTNTAPDPVAVEMPKAEDNGTPPQPLEESPAAEIAEPPPVENAVSVEKTETSALDFPPAIDETKAVGEDSQTKAIPT